jgi:Xaa-Pro aminopeptidase
VSVEQGTNRKGELLLQPEPQQPERTVPAKVASALESAGLDAVVGMSPDNATYLGGVAIPSQTLIRSRLAMSLITATGDSCHIVADMEESFARAETALQSVRAYNEFTETPAGKLAEVLKEMGLGEASLGLEMDFVPAMFLEELREKLPGAQLLHAAPFLDEMRTIKTPWEIERLKNIGRIAAEAHYEAYEYARPGMTELELAALIHNSIFRQGGESVVKLVVGSGPRCTQANPGPTSRVMQKGEMLRVDVYAAEKSYLSDVARTAVFGKATDEQKKTWSWLIEALNVSLELVGPGKSTTRIYKRFAECFENRGLRPINFLGHGLGLTLHEEPYINRFSDTILREGMVLCIEPYFMVPERSLGFQIEEEVLITSDGCEVITAVRPCDRLVEL